VVEQLIRNQQVFGSSPNAGSKKNRHLWHFTVSAFLWCYAGIEKGLYFASQRHTKEQKIGLAKLSDSIDTG
jgi:hypothetical protein